MRVAGKLAAEVLDFITQHVQPGVTTEEIDRLCHDYMVNVQDTVPAPLNYAPPGHAHTQNQFAHRLIIKYVMEFQVTEFLKKVMLLILILL